MSEHAPRPPEPEQYLPGYAPKPSRPEHLDSYGREKVVSTIGDLELAAATARNYLKMVDFANEKGIELPQSLMDIDRLRYPDGPAGPDSDIVKIRGVFQQAQIAVAKHIPVEHRQELDERIVGRKSEEDQESTNQ